MKPILIKTIEDIKRTYNSIQMAAENAKALFHAQADGITLLEKLKFSKSGFDPLQPQNEYNLVEQINQTFSYLVGLKGIRSLLEHHRNDTFTLAYGTSGGPDIYNGPQTIVCECFASMNHSNNAKLKNDIKKLETMEAATKYIFFYAHTTVPSKRFVVDAAEKNIWIIQFADLDPLLPQHFA